MDRLLADAERSTIRAVNALAMPWIQRGVWSSSLLPAGLTVLETRGRLSGRVHAIALQALFFPGGAVVGTYRSKRSDWLRNAAANPSIVYWVDGNPRSAEAEVHSGPGCWGLVVLRDHK
jgi:hypothetical protein